MKAATSETREIIVLAGTMRLPGTLRFPLAWTETPRRPASPARPRVPTGVVAFAHGSGSSRFSSRNRMVAERLAIAGIASLLVDLLTEEEAADRELVFDIPLLAGRLGAVVDWLAQDPAVRHLPVGLFGASTGAAVALRTAADDERVRVVVSRGGRPDLAAELLGRVRVPVLLVVGANDPVVLDLNRQALEGLWGPKDLIVVEGATHLFEESGALERVAELAVGWFARYLGSVTPR